MSKHKIYILLTDTGTILNRTIKLYTKAPYNHVSLSFDPELRNMYSFGRKSPRNPLNGGFVKEDVVNGMYKYFPFTNCCLYELEVTKSQLKKLKKEVSAFEKNCDLYSYNITGFVNVVLNKPAEKEYSYFCSQFVSELFKRSGIKLFKKDSSLITPEDFRRCNELKKIYEGSLYYYVHGTYYERGYLPAFFQI